MLFLYNVYYYTAIFYTMDYASDRFSAQQWRFETLEMHGVVTISGNRGHVKPIQLL